MNRTTLGLSRSSLATSRTVIVAAWCALALVGCNTPEEIKRPAPVNDAEADTLTDFRQRVAAYVDVHRRIEEELPKLSKDSTPKQIDDRQRELAARILAARSIAAQGDLLTPGMQTLIRNRFAKIFTKDKTGEAVKASVMDENPVGMALTINQRYPSEVPLSTMPPDVLEFLPKMPEGLEFRFVGRHLIVMDTHAFLVADFVPDAIPE